MLKENADYEYGIEMVLLMASNPDLTMPSPTRIVGGIGPFDFSGAADTGAVPFSVKIDGNTPETVNINVLAGCADITAVTVAELVILLTAAAFTDMAFSTEAGTSRLLCEYVGTVITPNYMQIYGECARLCDIGQGLGCQFVLMDGDKTLDEVPEMKAEESINTEDAQADITSVNIPSQRKGVAGTIVDTAQDLYLRAIAEGGTYNFTTGAYTAPLPSAQKIYWYMEVYSYRYAQGENAEGDISGYLQTIIKCCMGGFGTKMHQKGFVEFSYPFKGVTYTDASGDKEGDTDVNPLTEAAYEALDIENLQV